MNMPYLIAFTIVIVGLVNALYLSYHALKGTYVHCLFLPKEWCVKVQTSKYSRTFGIPNPYLGLCMLAAILLLLVLHYMFGIFLLLARLLIIFGAAFSIYFTYIQAFVLKAFCTWCVVSACVFMALFFTQFYL